MGFLKSILAALPALLVGLAGAGLAWVALKVNVVIALVAAVGFAGLGGIFIALARFQLYRSPPRTKSAVTWLGWGVLAPASIAAAIGAVLVWLAVDRTKTKLPEDAALITAVVTAATTFFTASFVEWTKDADGNMVANWTESMFENRFLNTFVAGSESELAALGDPLYGGWDSAARHERAKVIWDQWPTDNAPTNS
jgi:hypothetical protein